MTDSLFPDVALEPTPAMKAGASKLFQCNWCGTLVCIPGTRDDVARKPQGQCPGCTNDHGWSVQRLGTGPFRPTDAPGMPRIVIGDPHDEDTWTEFAPGDNGVLVLPPGLISNSKIDAFVHAIRTRLSDASGE